MTRLLFGGWCHGKSAATTDIAARLRNHSKPDIWEYPGMRMRSNPLHIQFHPLRLLNSRFGVVYNKLRWVWRCHHLLSCPTKRGLSGGGYLAWWLMWIETMQYYSCLLCSMTDPCIPICKGSGNVLQRLIASPVQWHQGTLFRIISISYLFKFGVCLRQ